MAIDAINAAISDHSQETPAVTQKKSSSTWNNICVSISKGCNKTADLFNKIFCAIGKFFTAVGKFLWNNKVTAGICAFLSATVLAISALLLSVFGKKKEITETPTQEMQTPEAEAEPTGNTIVDEPYPDLAAEQTASKEPAKDAMPNGHHTKGVLIKEMQQKIEAAKEQDPKNKEDAQMRTGDIKSSIDFSAMHSVLANLPKPGGLQPSFVQPISSTASEEAEANIPETKLTEITNRLADCHKNRVAPPKGARRLPARKHVKKQLQTEGSAQ